MKRYHQKTGGSVAFIFLIMALCLISPSNTQQSPVVEQSSCQSQDPQFFVTFHPHLDAFWLNTDDELKNATFRPAGFLYAMNQRNSKQIFDSMYDALIKNPNRKYFVTEIVFFKDWYDSIQSQEKRKNVSSLLTKTKQLQIGNSGWVQNDEAVCYFDDILDQYTLGMKWMYEQFGYVNRIGWATDSFGHSHSQVALEYLLGFEFQGIQRVDDRYVYQRNDKALLQFYWQPISDSNGKKYGGVLNQVRHFLHEVNDLRRSSAKSIKSDFEQLKKNMLNVYNNKTKMFRFLGNDFQEFIDSEFTILESGFGLLNEAIAHKDQCPEYKYGNPSDYLHAVKPYWSLDAQLQTRKYDFMPNWDQDRYWTGYYTTDPELKIICKDFSRLVNLVRKTMVKRYVGGVDDLLSKHGLVLNRAEELLSVMQHHDGITATSKGHIETLFKNRMMNSSKEMIDVLKQIELSADTVTPLSVCDFYKNNGSCQITEKKPFIELVVIHQGIAKEQQVQIHLPEGYLYKVVSRGNTDILGSYYMMNNPFTQTDRVLLLTVKLHPGKNVIKLKGIELQSQQFKQQKIQIHQYKSLQNTIFENDDKSINVNLDENVITYRFGDDFMRFSYETSTNTPSRRQTMAWNKYGAKTDKVENVNPGMYIMSNNGKLNRMKYKIESMHLLEWGGDSGDGNGDVKYYKIWFKYNLGNITIKFNTNEPSILQYDYTFTPPDRTMTDYFLKVESSVKNDKEQFYHDSNGYLVAKRQVGKRPDYEWEYKEQDKINANTYPVCSFFYIKESTDNDQGRKFVTFLDRAQGVALYDGSTLVNFDRLTQDDYKGAGEGYMYQRMNRFKMRFALIGARDDMERVWQRNYDEGLVGFVNEVGESEGKDLIEVDNGNDDADVQEQRDEPFNGAQRYLKHSLTFLNADEILLRIVNLAQFDNLSINKYSSESFKIQSLGLDLHYKDIRQSFANGLILKDRYNWIGDHEEINHYSRSTLDTKDSIVLQPLEIRSWRINLKGKIEDREIAGGDGLVNERGKLTAEEMARVDRESSHVGGQMRKDTTKPLIKHALRARCFDN